MMGNLTRRAKGMEIVRKRPRYLTLLWGCGLLLCTFLPGNVVAENGPLLPLSLNKGWNFISFPIQPETAAVNKLFGSTIRGPVWLYARGRYRPVEQVEAGNGYCCYAPQAVVLYFHGIAAGGNPDVSGGGWHLLGVRSPVMQPPGSGQPVWFYQQGRFKVCTRFLPGKAYWVHGTPGFSLGETDADHDQDDLPDYWESLWSLSLETNDANADPDADALNNLEEYTTGTGPRLADTDGDGLPDGWEVQYGTAPLVADADADPDDDGLSNLREFQAGTNPSARDSDQDGLADGREMDAGTSPTTTDSDGDGLSDGAEVNDYGTDPLAVDSDDDWVDDAAEVAARTNPLNAASTPAFPSLNLSSIEITGGVFAQGEVRNSNDRVMLSWSGIVTDQNTVQLVPAATDVVAAQVHPFGMNAVATLDQGRCTLSLSSFTIGESRAVLRLAFANGSVLIGSFTVYNITPARSTPAFSAAAWNQDPDGDRLVNMAEFLSGTNVLQADTDNGGLADGIEVAAGLNPLDPRDDDGDADGDAWPNLEEFRIGTDLADAGSVPGKAEVWYQIYLPQNEYDVFVQMDHPEYGSHFYVAPGDDQHFPDYPLASPGWITTAANIHFPMLVIQCSRSPGGPAGDGAFSFHDAQMEGLAAEADVSCEFADGETTGTTIGFGIIGTTDFQEVKDAIVQNGFAFTPSITLGPATIDENNGMGPGPFSFTVDPWIQYIYDVGQTALKTDLDLSISGTPTFGNSTRNAAPVWLHAPDPGHPATATIVLSGRVPFGGTPAMSRVVTLTSSNPQALRLDNPSGGGVVSPDQSQVTWTIFSNQVLTARISRGPEAESSAQARIEATINTIGENDPLAASSVLQETIVPPGSINHDDAQEIEPQQMTPLEGSNEATELISINIIGHLPGTVTAPGAEIPTIHEDAPLSLPIAVNDDDDNGDGVVDNADTILDPEDNDLALITLHRVMPSSLSDGTMKLEILPPRAAAQIRVMAEDGTVLHGGETVDLATPAGILSPLANGSQHLYVEGLAPENEVILRLSYSTTDGTEMAEDKVKLTIIKVDIAMDGNRDGEIKFDDPADAEYLFWVNDDYDIRHWEENEWHEDDALIYLFNTKNCDDNRIGQRGPDAQNNPIAPSQDCCRRDLEDFTRLHILVDDNTVSMSGITYWMKFENTGGTSPEVNLFEAINESLDYLKVGYVADLQIQKTKIITVGTAEIELPGSYIKDNNQRSPFILEGKTAGKGDLTLIVKKDGSEIFRQSVSLELRPIANFYQVFKIATVGANSTDVSVGYNPDFTSSDDYLLFVHGFNVNATDKKYWPATVFKRLWWQGYTGHVGFFDWPCVMFSYVNVQCYDDSEFNALRCAAALKDRIDRLNSGASSGKVRLLAHSQGNVIAGEALHLAASQIVHTYIASQAAVASDAYQGGLTTYLSSPDTPNVYLSYPPTSNPWFAGVGTKAGQCFSYFNPGDYALHSVGFGSWEWNNEARPDVFYHYEGPLTTYDISASPTPSRFYYDVVPSVLPAPRDMVFPADQYEIFSYSAELRFSPLGMQPVMIDFSTFDLRTMPVPYGTAHYSHSRQFRSNIVDEWDYWKRVISDCGF